MRNSRWNLISYREVIWALAWKSIIVRYKQAYLGVAWAVLRPLALLFVFCLVRVFVDIDSGGVPYPVLTFAALMPWMLFQDATSEGVASIVNNASLVRKIYFPREIFPLTAVLTKLIEFCFSILALVILMIVYHVPLTLNAIWAPPLIAYLLLVSLSLCLAGSALNVYFRDVSAAMPVALSLLMYASPIIYPLSLVRRKLLDEQIAGTWSESLYILYTANPLAGIIDSFQRVVIRGISPDWGTLIPGAVVTIAVLPFSYWLFKNAEDYFADVV